jgi:hypothetical protein
VLLPTRKPTLLHRSPSKNHNAPGNSQNGAFPLVWILPWSTRRSLSRYELGGGVLKSRFLNSQHHVTNHSTGPGSLSLWEFICSLSFFSFCCLIVMSSKSLLLTKCITIAPPNFTLFLQSLLPALIRVFHYFSLALFK